MKQISLKKIDYSYFKDIIYYKYFFLDVAFTNAPDKFNTFLQVCDKSYCSCDGKKLALKDILHNLKVYRVADLSGHNTLKSSSLAIHQVIDRCLLSSRTGSTSDISAFRFRLATNVSSEVFRNILWVPNSGFKYRTLNFPKLFELSCQEDVFSLASPFLNYEE